MASGWSHVAATSPGQPCRMNGCNATSPVRWSSSSIHRGERVRPVRCWPAALHAAAGRAGAEAAAAVIGFRGVLAPNETLQALVLWQVPPAGREPATECVVAAESEIDLLKPGRTAPTERDCSGS